LSDENEVKDVPPGFEEDTVTVENFPWFNLYLEPGGGEGQSIHIAQQGHAGIDRLVVERTHVKSLIAALLILAPEAAQ
jgi:hypothetical protein